MTGGSGAGRIITSCRAGRHPPGDRSAGDSGDAPTATAAQLGVAPSRPFPPRARGPTMEGHQTPGDDRLRRGRFVGVVASRGAGGLVKPRQKHKCEVSRLLARCLAQTRCRALAPGACDGTRLSQQAGQCPRNACLSRPGGHSIRLALLQPRRRGEHRARYRAPDILVDATFHAIADVGSIPTVSTDTSRIDNPGHPCKSRSLLICSFGGDLLRQGPHRLQAFPREHRRSSRRRVADRPAAASRKRVAACSPRARRQVRWRGTRALQVSAPVLEDVCGRPVVGEPTLETVRVPEMRGRGGIEVLERHVEDCGDPLAEPRVPVQSKRELNGGIAGELEERDRAVLDRSVRIECTRACRTGPCSASARPRRTALGSARAASPQVRGSASGIPTRVTAIVALPKPLLRRVRGPVSPGSHTTCSVYPLRLVHVEVSSGTSDS